VISVATSRDATQLLKKQLEESNANTSKADLDLIKNLVIGYITASNASTKSQILKLISNVLSLNEMECSRVGLNSGGAGSSWFRSASDNVNNNISLTEAFVSFLEKESQPRANSANLLTIHEDAKPTASRKTSTASGTDVAKDEPNLNDSSLIYENRNSSSILKNLLHDDTA